MACCLVSPVELSGTIGVEPGSGAQCHPYLHQLSLLFDPLPRNLLVYLCHRWITYFLVGRATVGDGRTCNHGKHLHVVALGISCLMFCERGLSLPWLGSDI